MTDKPSQPEDHKGPSRLHAEPGIAAAEEGMVLLDGPDGVAVAMTPDAASETSASLAAAALDAKAQRDAAAKK